MSTEKQRNGDAMKKRKPRARPKLAPACHCHNANPSITSLFTEVFEHDDQDKQEEFHEALSHSPAFNFLLEVAQEEDTALCCLLSDAIRIGWRAGQREQECKKLEDMVGYGK